MMRGRRQYLAKVVRFSLEVSLRSVLSDELLGLCLDIRISQIVHQKFDSLSGMVSQKTVR